MNNKTWLTLIFVSGILGSALNSIIGAGQWTFGKGFYLSFGWLNQYPKGTGIGLPFTTERPPPSTFCLCVADTNSVSGFLNISFWIILVLVIILVIRKVLITKKDK